MDAAHYFDHAATTPIEPEVLEAMLPYLREDFGNANSIHSWGMRAHAAVDRAREQLAAHLGCAPDEIVFTSGATEANNWVLQSFHEVAVSPFEHSSVWETAQALGFEMIEASGWSLDPPAPECELVSVMTVNNETGAILACPDPRPSGRGPMSTANRGEGVKVHRDITQGLGKIPVDLGAVDFASMSAHKMYGPKGVGALFIRGGEPLEPLLYGGEQEQGLRAGTLNVPAIVGFGAAAEMARARQSEDFDLAVRLRNTVMDELGRLQDWHANAHTEQSPFILSLSFFGVEGETLVVEADNAGFAVSSGAACSSRSTEPSHVLTALGVEDEWSRGTIRVSFGRANTVESAASLAKVLKTAVENLRNPDKRPGLGNKF